MSSAGVVAGIGAMLAAFQDRPGSRRAAIKRQGLPALAGACGLLVGSYAGAYTGPVVLTLVLTGLGLVAGSVSAIGPVASGAGTQLLVTAAIGAGMGLPEPGWQRVLFFLAGAGWLIVLRVALPATRFGAGDYRFDGERTAVAAVYQAISALLTATGGPEAAARRAALTAALDHAQDALSGPRLRRRPGSRTERRLHAQFTAALPLAEAATALAWAGDPVPARAAEGPRRLAAAVRAGGSAGPLPAPARSAPALRALDDALLGAADAFDRGAGTSHRGTPARRRGTAGAVLRTLLGSGGREYGIRVALSFGAAVAVAQALHHLRWWGVDEHWYWLPATAVFLVKPDLGPLASRILCRAAGTAFGALVFAAFAALLPRPAGLIALVALCCGLIPVAARHFAAQTAVVTVLVLALIMVGGELQASAAVQVSQTSWNRVAETLLACAIVLVVGHLPTPLRRGGGVRARLVRATEAAQSYLAHVLSGSDDRAGRWTLRREAYRSLAEARAAIALAAAELPALARYTKGTDEAALTLERLLDTTTACAVHLDDTGRLTARHTQRIADLLEELARHRDRAGLPAIELAAAA
ncbi:FUSC family protein [Streptomyces sp. NPDC059786]|uniref:FUSC family protein n=1 Tax=Streptomyces sp. NPDC059786 TaxID=3346946 RepID=UPI00364FB569